MSMKPKRPPPKWKRSRPFQRFMKRTGLRVKELRRERGLEVSALSDLSRINERHIRAVEAGHTNLTLFNVYRLCTAFGIEPYELLTPKESGVRAQTIRQYS